jgi:tRNA pseudouridine55 synthase
MFNARKAGHTGSLDPLASGLLPICFGEATKFGAQLLDADKTYRVTVRLGERTPSADRETDVIERRELPHYSLQQIEQALRAFPREYSQVPPMHSALKQDGKPLYQYARLGLTRERSARDIVIRRHAAARVALARRDIRRVAQGHVHPGAGGDLAAQMGTIAHLAALAGWEWRRLCGTAMVLRSPRWPERTAAGIWASQALTCWRRLDLPPGGVNAIRQGQTVSMPADLPGTVRIYAAGMGFLGLGEIEPTGRLVPVRLISSVPTQIGES